VSNSKEGKAKVRDINTENELVF